MNTDVKPHHHHLRFTMQILIGMGLGLLAGLAIRLIPMSEGLRSFLISGIFDTGGQIFINVIRMLVIPIVLVSLVCGSSSLGDLKRFGRVGGKTLFYYIITTTVAISLAVLIAIMFHVGDGVNLQLTKEVVLKAPPSFKEIIINLFPSNPFRALNTGYMLQIIVFSILFGVAITATGKPGEKIAELFRSTNEVLMKLITMIMKTAPYGVFFLLGALFAKLGFSVIVHILGYFLIVLLVLMLQLFGTYSLMLRVIGRLNPVIFFKKMYAAMLFAFSISSSNASIPVVLKTVEEKLGVKNSIASFVIPLGSTINMDGTAIMQGVATVFIANAYHINIGLGGYLTVILMATLASIGTAGAPGVGLITLAMVLEQVGLPVSGIALIFGVDRLLDMTRTAVNISGDATVACLVSRSEDAFDLTIYQDMKLIDGEEAPAKESLSKT